MKQYVYSNKIRDPRSQSVTPGEKYLVCKKINGKWHIIQSNKTDHAAYRACYTLAKHDLINDHITDPNVYEVFHRDHVEIKEKLDD